MPAAVAARRRWCRQQGRGLNRATFSGFRPAGGRRYNEPDECSIWRIVMKPDQLEARLAAMENEIADIRPLLEERIEPKKDWRSTFGMFAGEAVAQAVAEEI